MNIDDRTFLVRLLSGYWHINNINPNLGRLQRQGYIIIKRFVSGTGTNRNTYSLTLKGVKVATNSLDKVVKTNASSKYKCRTKTSNPKHGESAINWFYDAYGKRSMDERKNDQVAF